MKLVQRADGSGRVAALEILKVSPKIAKMIEKGETGEMHEELESSVGYYRMQSMNQSLIALLVNGVITVEEAMEQSPDHEDLSLKLRKMFPKIIEGDEMGTSDFSQISELKEYRRMYEEQEEKAKLRMAERDEQIQQLRLQIQERDETLQQAREQMAQINEERERMQTEYKRLKTEAGDKLGKLNERIKELNQEIASHRGGGAKKSGIFG
jgi:twitching motility protein PilT